MSCVQLTGAVVFSTTPPKKKASTVIAADSLLTMVGGFAQPAGPLTKSIVGITPKAVAAVDADYADANTIPVLIPHDEATFLMEVGTGVIGTAVIGERYDLKDSVSVNVNSQAVGQVTVVGKQDGKLVVKLNCADTYVNSEES